MAFALGPAAHAVPMTAFIEGTIEFVDDELVIAPIEIGNAFHGSYRLDPAAPEPSPSSTTLGTPYVVGPGAASVLVEEVEFDLASMGGAQIFVGNDRSGVDRWFLLGRIFSDSVIQGSCLVAFEDDTGSALDSEELIVPTDLADWTTASFQCFATRNEGTPNLENPPAFETPRLALEGTLNRVFVPEPGTGYLLSLGLAAVGIARRLREIGDAEHRF